MERIPSFSVSLLAGGTAGLAVDMSLYPLDTLKTRSQSKEGLWKSGGFRNIYRGIGPVAAGSVPCAAIFFCTYNSCKSYLGHTIGTDFKPVIHLLSASAGEVASCSIRVPVEIIKQRLQATNIKKSALQLAIQIWRLEGARGFYHGLGSTILRDVPFSCLQFPLWEFLKTKWQERKGKSIAPWEGAVCGAVAGALSAAFTTPLDVAKTQIMLFNPQSSPGSSSVKVPTITETMRSIYQRHGIQGLFAGLAPRVMWITVGGLIFFNVYEHTVDALDRR